MAAEWQDPEHLSSSYWENRKVWLPPREPTTQFVTLYTPEVKRSSPSVVVCLVAMVRLVKQAGFAAVIAR
jgi:hypothetical protein